MLEFVKQLEIKNINYIEWRAKNQAAFQFYRFLNQASIKVELVS